VGIKTRDRKKTVSTVSKKENNAQTLPENLLVSYPSGQQKTELSSFTTKIKVFNLKKL